MSFQALTIKAPGIAQSILIPVVVGQSKSLCQKFGLNKIDANIYAVLDTGATNTAISDVLASSLGLKAIGEGRIKAAGGVHRTKLYSIDVLLRNMVSFTSIRATQFVKTDQVDLLLGMDILTLGDLSITNCDHRTVVSFRVPPDDFHIDYVEVGNDENMTEHLKELQTKKHRRNNRQ
jgi:hypothetical protein